MQLDPTARRGAIEKALLEYHRSPGKYALARRQPAVLYTGIKDVLQLASGRIPEGAGGPTPGHAVQQAASFFIRTAMLYPDADHYALLGLEHDAEAAVVKDRYRMMMRLMHPDFASAMSGAWPQDAATRVNRAYEILSSPVERRAYDEQLEPVAAARAEVQTSPGRLAPAQGAAPSRRRPEDTRRDLKRLSLVFGAAGGVTLAVVGVTLMQPDKESLVQRAAREPAREQQAAKPKPATAQPPERAPEPQTTIATLPPPEEPRTMVAETAPWAPALPVPSPPPARAIAPTRTALPSTAPPAAAAPMTLALMQPAAPAPAPIAAPAAVPAPSPLPVALAAPLPPAPAPAPPAPARPAPYTGPTMAEVHPMLARLLQEIESGWGDRVINLVDRDARGAPASQALLQHYNNLIDGVRPVKVSNVHFNAQPQGARLLVTGRLVVQAPDRGLAARELAVQAEFASREGGVVMTRLTRAPE